METSAPNNTRQPGRRRMGRGKVLLVVLLCIALGCGGFFGVHAALARVLRCNTEKEVTVFVPGGFADRYQNPYYFGIGTDTLVIWQYNLNKAQRETIQQELENGTWQKAGEAQRNWFKFVVGNDKELAAELSQDVYCAAFDLRTKEMVAPDNMGPGQQSFFFDKETNIYYSLIVD